MKLLILLSAFIFVNEAISANCFPIYEAKAKEINAKKASTFRVGDQLTVQGGQLFYNPGISVPAKVDNWVRDYLSAIEWGANPIMKDDPRQQWLSSLYKSIKQECPDAEKHQYKKLRKILTELMEDGTLCPAEQVLKSTVLSPYASFKKVLKVALKDQRFQDLCSNKAVVDTSDRTPKNIRPTTAPSIPNSTTQH